LSLKSPHINLGRTRPSQAPERTALLAKFLEQAGGDPVRAEHLRLAYYKRLALKSAQSRRKTKEFTAQAEAAEAELQGGGPNVAA
jgi:hypothetical protein